MAALLDMGFTASTQDPCLLYKDNFLVIMYDVDDVGAAAPSDDITHNFVADLKSCSFKLTKEGTFFEYLGIKFKEDKDARMITLTQKGLIQKILTATGMTNGNPNCHLAAAAALSIDPDGQPYQEKWNYTSVVSMLLYFSSNTCPDISFTMSQVARFNHNPKQLHATTLKMILHYLKGTADKGMIIKPSGKLALEMWCDADYAGLYHHDPDTSASAAKSRGAFLITLSDVPLFWKTQLHSEITLSTTEAE